MRLIGLTGGIATGKSTVAALLRERGFPVIDADVVARDVLSPGSPAYDALVAALGPEILSPDGSIDRAGMRERLSRSPRVRHTLNRITHPAIRARIVEALDRLAADGHPAAFVEAALLVETGGYQAYPELLVVTTTPEAQLARLMARDGMAEDAARALIATQLPLAEKERVATTLLRNDGDPAQLQRAVDDLLATLGLTPLASSSPTHP